MAKELRIPADDLHDAKKEIVSDLKDFAKAIDALTPNIGVVNADRKIALKNRKTGATTKTDTPLKDFCND